MAQAPLFSQMDYGPRRSLDLSEYVPTVWESAAAGFREAWRSNPLPSMQTWADVNPGQAGGSVMEGMDSFAAAGVGGVVREAASPWQGGMPLEEQAKKIEEAGLSKEVEPRAEYDAKALNIILERKREQITERQLGARAPLSHLPFSLVGGAMASLLDPVAIASAFVPGIGEERALAMLARHAHSLAGRSAARAAKGAADGAVGAALLEPLAIAGQKATQEEYDAASTLMNISLGAVMGAALQPAAGAVGEWLARRSGQRLPWQTEMPTEKSQALREANAKLIENVRMAANPLQDRAAVRKQAVADAAAWDIAMRRLAWEQNIPAHEAYSQSPFDLRNGERLLQEADRLESKAAQLELELEELNARRQMLDSNPDLRFTDDGMDAARTRLDILRASAIARRRDAARDIEAMLNGDTNYAGNYSPANPAAEYEESINAAVSRGAAGVPSTPGQKPIPLHDGGDALPGDGGTAALPLPQREAALANAQGYVDANVYDASGVPPSAGQRPAPLPDSGAAQALPGDGGKAANPHPQKEAAPTQANAGPEPRQDQIHGAAGAAGQESQLLQNRQAVKNFVFSDKTPITSDREVIERLAAIEPVRVASGQDIPGLANGDLGRARKEVITRAKAQWPEAGIAVKPEAGGGEIILKAAGVKDALHHSHGEAKLQAIAMLPDIIKNSVPVDPPIRKGVAGPVSHFYVSRVNIDGKNYVAGIVGRESEAGIRFYDLELAEEYRPGIQHARTYREDRSSHVRCPAGGVSLLWKKLSVKPEDYANLPPAERPNLGTVISYLRHRLGVRDGSARVLFDLAEPSAIPLPQGGIAPHIKGAATFSQDFLQDGKAVIRIFQNHDSQTTRHELAHVLRRQYERLAASPDASPELLRCYQNLEREFDVTPGQPWTVAQEEKFAESFTRWISTGAAPSRALANSFAIMREQGAALYAEADQAGLEISGSMRNLFASMLTTPMDEGGRLFRSAVTDINTRRWEQEFIPREGPAQPGQAVGLDHEPSPAAARHGAPAQDEAMQLEEIAGQLAKANDRELANPAINEKTRQDIQSQRAAETEAADRELASLDEDAMLMESYVACLLY